ncbi:unnamed protein product [Arabis nemorensis]|uniref:F-box protein n=1 Tax=Arabis nemorensis TaxID=586526 RepID=A0A565C5B2_9BRAS|nr:unnamed protein product [Arabis nemorensis]
MANGVCTVAFSFSDIPEDIQLCVLSFLSPVEISSFACTSKRFASLCREDGKIWHAMCDRRWGQKTQIQKWGESQVTYRLLYKTLVGLENLIGFWRLCNRANPVASSPPLVLFEWGPSFVMGSRAFATSYQVRKTPFLLMGISPQGRPANFLDPNGTATSSADLKALSGDIVPVDVNFLGNDHIMVEENRCFTNNLGQERKSPSSSSGDDNNIVTSPNFLVVEMYTQLANRTSPSGDRRRQRRKEKERHARAKWEPQHFIKVIDCLCPAPSKPLQGLWKGKLAMAVLFFIEEGRVWLYEDETFGFGFVRDQFINDLKCVNLEDCYLADELGALQ